MAAGYGKGDAMVRKAQSMIEPGVMDIRKGKTGAPVNPVPPAVVRQRRDIARMAKVNPPPPGYKKGGAVKMKAEGGTSKRGPRRDADGSPGAIRTMRNEREFMEMPEGTKQKHAMKSALGIQEKKKGGAVKKMKDGGISKESSADMKQDKAVVRTAVHKHERAMHQGKPMTKLKKGGAAKSPCAAYKPKKMAAGGAAKERKDFPAVKRSKLTSAI